MMDGEGPCLVVLGNVQGWGRVGELLDFYAYSRIICADAGQKVAARLGLRATDFIGDFDSSPVPAGKLRRADADGQILPENTLDAPPADPAQATVYVLPAEKNVTDAEAAVDLAVSLGYRRIDILGGCGGRLDHTLGNLGILSKYAGRGELKLRLFDGFNQVRLVGPGSHRVAKNPCRFFGVIPYGGDAQGVTLRGVKYPLQDFCLRLGTTLGVSNEILGEAAEVELRQGRLLLISSRD